MNWSVCYIHNCVEFCKIFFLLPNGANLTNKLNIWLTNLRKDGFSVYFMELFLEFSVICFVFLGEFFWLLFNAASGYSNVGRLLCTPVPLKIYEKACCWFFFQLRELISTKITFIIHFMTAPLICLIHCIKKVEKLTVENFHFPHLILFSLTFKEPALENSYYLKKEVGR